MTEAEIHEENARQWKLDEAWSDKMGEPFLFFDGHGFWARNGGVTTAPALQGVYLRNRAKSYGPEFIDALNRTLEAADPQVRDER